MSRTDKDRPYRVKVMDRTLPREAVHDHRPIVRWCITGEREVISSYRYWDSKPVFSEGIKPWERDPIHYTRMETVKFAHVYENPCDLDDQSVYDRFTWRDRNCYWHLAGHSWYTSSNVPRWYRSSHWYNPERTRERDTFREMAKEYNANGYIEDGDFPNPQHHHEGQWYWD